MKVIGVCAIFLYLDLLINMTLGATTPDSATTTILHLTTESTAEMQSSPMAENSTTIAENSTAILPTNTTVMSSTNTLLAVSTTTQMDTTTTAPNTTMAPTTTTSPTTSMTQSTTTAPTTTISLTTTSQPTTSTGLPPTTKACTQASGTAGAQESEFGRVGFVAFGITFTIAVILLIILIIMVARRRKHSGSYVTGEAPASGGPMSGPPVMIAMNDGGFENVQTIDLDKAESERKLGNGTGLSSFAVKTETDTSNEAKEKDATDEAKRFSFSKTPDAGSVNNLLKEENSDKESSSPECSDDEGDPAATVGLKVEPSAGVSVESLEQVKETDNLMGDRSRTPSIDDNLPPPSPLGSENSLNNKELQESGDDDVTEM